MKKSVLCSALALCGSLALTGCATTGSGEDKMAAEAAAAEKSIETTVDKVRYEAVMAEAEAARKKAASVGGEWRDTGKILKSAAEAASKGDYATAIKLAEKAKRQGELGYEQAMSEKDAGNPLYLVN